MMSMVRNLLRKHLRANDEGISPVIGTILMVAATVIIGGAVYAAVNAYSGKASKSTTDAAFKAQALDTDGDGLEDVVKITYLSGPSSLDNATISLSVRDGAGASLNQSAAAHAGGGWSPGDYRSFAGSAGVVYVTVAVAENTVLDQTLALRE